MKKGKKVLGKNTTKKRTTTKKVSKKAKKVSLISRFQGLSRRSQMLVFGLVFAVLGGGYFLYQSFASDGLPDGANDLVVSYEIGMNHVLPDDAFPTGANTTGLLLYGNGLLLCSQDTLNMASMTPEEMAKMPDNGLQQRQLTRDEVRALVDGLKSNGFDAAVAADSRVVPLAGKAHSILLNTDQGATTVYGMGGDFNPAGFTKAENFLKAECAKATTAYSPDDVYAETITLSSDHPDAKNASGQLPAGFDVDPTVNEHAAKNITGKDAKNLKAEVAGSKVYTTADGKVVRARVVTKIPDYKDPKPKQESTKGKASAAAIYKVRFIAVIPQDVSTPNWATSGNVQDAANSIRNWYYGKTGKYFDFDSSDPLNFKIVRGSKTTAQYMSCPSSTYPTIYTAVATYPFPCGGGSSPVVNNMEAEFHKAGVSTIILSAINPQSDALGWGWQGQYDDSNGLISNAGLVGVAFAGKTDSNYGQKRVRRTAAHEQGHTMGPAHVCSATLMWKGGSCPLYDAWPNTRLDSGQAANLKAYSKFFSAPATSGGTTTTFTGYAMKPGTSPAISGNIVMYQASWGSLDYRVLGGGGGDLSLGMADKTSPAIDGDKVAFQANSTSLWRRNMSTGVAEDLRLGMMPGTSPSISGDRIVFQANTTTLYMRVLGGGTSNFGLGMAGGTSPAIYNDKIVFQANTGHLWRKNLSTGVAADMNLGMAGGTSPAIYGDYVVFQANTGQLYLTILGGGGTRNTGLGMMPGTSPAIYDNKVVFQANTGHLWRYNISTGGAADLGLGMAGGTSPDIYGDDIVFQANTGVLWRYNLSSGSGGIVK